jgi:hypothetical protein
MMSFRSAAQESGVLIAAQQLVILSKTPLLR